MTEADRVKAIVADLNLPQGRFVVSGSGVMVLHGLERAKVMGDLDIFCSTQTWFELYDQTVPHPHAPDDGDNRERVWKLWTTDPDDPARRCDPAYLYRYMYGLEVNVFHAWRRRGVGDIDVNFWMANPTEIDGVPCIPLQFLLDWKIEVGRAKDVDDIKLLKDYLSA